MMVSPKAVAENLDSPKPLDEEIDVFGLTHAGKVREENADHFLICSLHKQMQLHGTSLPTVEGLAISKRIAIVMVVADGVGGSAGGREASRITIEELLSYVQHTMRCYYTEDPEQEAKFLRALERGVRESHESVVEAGRETYRFGMATTLTLLVSIWPLAWVVQVGDSRCYRLRRGRLEQLTRDQTLAQDLLDKGVIGTDTAQISPLRHVLSGAVGGREVEPIITSLRHEREDVILLCSDGLTRHVKDDEISSILTRTTSAQQACEELVATTLERGARDNVTVLVARVKP